MARKNDQVKRLEEKDIPDIIVRAFVYRDHMGEGWYAYYPTADDTLDGEGSIHARWFGTPNEANRYVREAIAKAANRPRQDTVGMEEMSVIV